MITTKQKVIKDYEKLSKELKEQIKLVYPEGYAEYLISVSTLQGKRITALPFETYDKIYLIRMSSNEALLLIDDDNDYDTQGNLKTAVRGKYEDKHADAGYLSENENYQELQDA